MTSRIVDSLAYAELLEHLTPYMFQAGQMAIDARITGLVSRQKEGVNGWEASPVTETDEAIEKLLSEAILAIVPNAVIVGEESSASQGTAPAAELFWLIDPIDGTQDYIGGGSEFSVNIGLIHEGYPVLGLVLDPNTGILWTGARGLGAWKQSAPKGRQPIRTRTKPAQALALTSRSRLDPRTVAWLDQVPDLEHHPLGASLKFVELAQGNADFYPRYGPTSEWDTAAADAVFRAAGGVTLVPGGGPLIYGKAHYLNGPLLAVADPTVVDQLPPFEM